MSHWSAEDIKRVTNENKIFYESLRDSIENFELDMDKDKRLELELCKACHYLDLKTPYCNTPVHSACGICGESVLSPNSNMHKICSGCAQKYKICRHCGGTMD